MHEISEKITTSIYKKCESQGCVCCLAYEWMNLSDKYTSKYRAACKKKLLGAAFAAHILPFLRTTDTDRGNVG